MENAVAYRVLPNILFITSTHPEKTIFTRFIRARKPGQGCGMWRHYYERWGSMTIEQLGPEMVGLVPDLAQYVPPAQHPTKHGADLGCIREAAQVGPPLGVIPWRHASDDPCRSLPPVTEVATDVWFNKDPPA